MCKRIPGNAPGPADRRSAVQKRPGVSGRLRSDRYRIFGDPGRLRSDRYRTFEDPGRLRSDRYRTFGDPGRLRPDRAGFFKGRQGAGRPEMVPAVSVGGSRFFQREIRTALSRGPRVNLDETMSGGSSPAGKEMPLELQTRCHFRPLGMPGRSKVCSSQCALTRI